MQEKSPFAREKPSEMCVCVQYCNIYSKLETNEQEQEQEQEQYYAKTSAILSLLSSKSMQQRAKTSGKTGPS